MFQDRVEHVLFVRPRALSDRPQRLPGPQAKPMAVHVQVVRQQDPRLHGEVCNCDLTLASLGRGGK